MPDPIRKEERRFQIQTTQKGLIVIQKRLIQYQADVMGVHNTLKSVAHQK